MSFRIEPRNIIETGIDRIEFDASKVKLLSDTNDDDPSWGNEAERRIVFAYEDAEVCQKITVDPEIAITELVAELDQQQQAAKRDAQASRARSSLSRLGKRKPRS